jgi:para-aminobenzoate synthetase component I
MVRETAWPSDLIGAVAAFSCGAESAWLDSATSGDARPFTARCSLLCRGPLAVLEQRDQQPARLIADRRTIAENADGWTLWRQVHNRLPRAPLGPWALTPGWVGYVSFEMARHLERLPESHREDLGLPLLRMALFDRGVVLDHRHHRAFFVTAPGMAEALGLEPSCAGERAEDEWTECVRAERTHVPPAPALRLQHEISRADYERMVARALEYIAAGDIYQVNLSHRLQLAGVTDALSLYAAGRQSNPAPYGALLRWDGSAVASFSPELFLQLRGDEVRTCPIKGTRPRTGSPATDEAARRELLTSAKEAAELTMIVDLHRNDLGRVCRYGSVRVEHPRRVEAHPSVFHTVADVVGQLAPGRDALDLLAACFPAGSISGVPKIRALQIIDELEPVARGVYTGAIGVLGLDGQMTFNVAIRTLQIRGTTATLYVGGGIVADSDPAAEYEETLAKGRGILRGVANTSAEPGSPPQNGTGSEPAPLVVLD